jgi:S1-C subfamily serine protease
VATGRTYAARVVGTDRTDDVAVLQLQGASGLTTVSLGDSSTLAVGDAVVGIGNALGAGGAPSAVDGVVQALDQSITANDSNGGGEQLTGLIRTTAPLQPGDSGGPLATAAGTVVGMDTAASSSFRFQAVGVSYAIPINTAVSIARQIEAGHASGTIHIGPAAFLGVQVQDSPTGGALVAGVERGTPAAAAGLAGGDTIVQVGGTRIDSASTLTDVLGTHHPGDRVAVAWTDADGRDRTATVTLATGPAS